MGPTGSSSQPHTTPDAWSPFAPTPLSSILALLFQATVTLARGQTNINCQSTNNCQKTARSERLRKQSQPTAAHNHDLHLQVEGELGMLSPRLALRTRVTTPPEGQGFRALLCPYLAFPTPPVIPPHEILVVLILLGQVVVQDAVCHRLQRHGQVRERKAFSSSIQPLPSPDPVLLKGRSQSSFPASQQRSARRPRGMRDIALRFQGTKRGLSHRSAETGMQNNGSLVLGAERGASPGQGAGLTPDDCGN